MILSRFVIFFWAAFMALAFCFALGEDFFSGSVLMTHDNYYWALPAFTHWARSILNFDLPFFDFFSNGGVPFGPLLVQLRMVDPIDMLTTIFSVTVTDNIVGAFNIKTALMALLNAASAYLFLSIFLKNTVSKLFAITTLMFSCYVLGTFRQNGLLLVCQWSGLIFFLAYHLFFVRRYSKPILLLLLGALLANTLYGYSYAGLFFIIIIAIFLHYRNFALRFKTYHRVLPLMALLAMPTLALYLDSDKFIFPARTPGQELVDGKIEYRYVQHEPEAMPTGEQNLIPSYEVLADVGVSGFLIDFVTLISPAYNMEVYPTDKLTITGLNEVYFFFGTFALMFVPVGFAYFLRHKSKLSLFFIPVFLFYLGPGYLVHELVYAIFPPIWPMRHATLIAPFLQLLLILFAAKGFDLSYTTMVSLASKNYRAIVELRKKIRNLLSVFFPVLLIVPYLSTQMTYGVESFIAIGLALIFFLLTQVTVNKRAKIAAFIGILGLSFLQLAFHMNRSLDVLLQPNIIGAKLSVKVEGESLLSVVTEKAALHAGCYSGNSGQAIRYPGLLTYQRSIYSVPDPLGADKIDAYNQYCKNITAEDQIKNMRRWNVLAQYKNYVRSATDRDASLMATMGHLIPNATVRKNVSEVTSDSITFKDVELQSGLFVNLFFDDSWSAKCDGSLVPLKKSKQDISVFSQTDILPEGMLIIDDRKCDVLTLHYDPKFFVYSVKANILFSVILLCFLLYWLLAAVFFPKKLYLLQEK
jgi:hypothetical protein